MTKKKDPKDLLPVGRKKVPFDLPEGWQDVIKFMYANGASDSEVMVWIMENRPSRTFSNDLWARWMEEIPEFSETITGGRIIAKAWFEKVARENLANPRFSFNGWLMQVRNRFRYTTEDPKVREDDDSNNQKTIAPVINVLPPKEE